MKRFKKPKSKKKPVTMTRHDINDLEARSRKEAANMGFYLFLAYMVDEPEIDCDEDRVVALWEKLTDWAEHVEDHTITIRQVQKIIEERVNQKKAEEAEIIYQE